MSENNSMFDRDDMFGKPTFDTEFENKIPPAESFTQNTNNPFEMPTFNSGQQGIPVNPDFFTKPGTNTNINTQKGGMLHFAVVDHFPNQPPVKMPFNWGAALLSGWWSIFNRQPWLFFGFIIAGVIVSTVTAGIGSFILYIFQIWYFGTFAGELAFAAIPGLTIEEYNRTSKICLWIALGLMALSLLILCAFFTIFTLTPLALISTS